MIIGYKVSGHAEFSEEGTDIICSAISTVTQAPIIGLQKHLKLDPFYAVDEENGELEVALNSAPTDLTEAILQTMAYTVADIERQCPEYVHMMEHRR